MTSTTDGSTGATVYALLVGIDDYLTPVPALYGCKNDVRHLGDYLTGRLGTRLRLATLLDRAATRQAVIDTFRSHLGQAGPGDVALFAYSGHGSEESAPAEFQALEASGKIQNLVCADSGRRIKGALVRALADKELAVLISEVAARGARVTVLLDCCNSGNGTRDASVRVRQWLPSPDEGSARERAAAVEMSSVRSVEGFLTGAASATRLDHVALSACQSFQVAKETALDGEPRGAFSIALLDALRTVGPTTTYRSLLAAVRARVERTTAEQNPVLFPAQPGGPADSLVLDGSVQHAPVLFHMTRTGVGWEVDAGSIHGLVAPSGDEAFELACSEPGAPEVAGTVRVTVVGPARSTVEPEGWAPLDIAYDAVVSAVPLPAAVVRFDPSADVAAKDAYTRVAASIAVAGPGGTPSPYLAVDAEPGAGSLVLRVAAHPNGYEVLSVVGAASVRTEGACLRVLRADGTPVTTDVPSLDDGAVRAVVARLEHVARWEQLRRLGDHPSRLRDAVRLEVLSAEPGEKAAPVDRLPLDPGAGYELTYRRIGPEWSAPAMFLRLANTSERDLYVAVLDLTDRYRCHAALYPTERISAGRTVAVWAGEPIDASLPAGRPVVSGAMARDWLKVIVSETNFDATAFEMPALDEPFVARRSVAHPESTLERLAARVLTRDVGSGPPASSVSPEWCSETYTVTIRVP